MEADFNAFAESLSASSEEDDGFSTADDSSDDSDGASSGAQQQHMNKQFCSTRYAVNTNNPINLVHKIYNREVSSIEHYISVYETNTLINMLNLSSVLTTLRVGHDLPMHQNAPTSKCQID